MVTNATGCFSSLSMFTEKYTYCSAHQTINHHSVTLGRSESLLETLHCLCTLQQRGDLRGSHGSKRKTKLHAKEAICSA